MAEQVPAHENQSHSQAPEKRSRLVRVWDPMVRIGHWLLVGGFGIAYLTAETNSDAHVIAGYVVAAVVGFRVVWGFVGPDHAKFASFVRGPVAVFGYLGGLFTGKARRSLGHNPAGAAMILALLLSVGGTAISGMALYAVEEGKGPLAGFFPAEPAAAGRDAEADEHGERAMERPSASDEEGHRGAEQAEEFYEDVHKAFVNFTILLIVLHVGGVIASSLAHRENLVRAMVTGRKRADD